MGPLRLSGRKYRGGTNTRARLTLLDVLSDANETSHSRSLHLGGVLAARSVENWVFVAVDRPCLLLRESCRTAVFVH
jgi:hypothetical protein